MIGFAIGVTSGSVLMRFLKLEGRKAAAWVAVCSAVAACLSFLNAGVGCQSTMTLLGEMQVHFAFRFRFRFICL